MLQCKSEVDAGTSGNQHHVSAPKHQSSALVQRDHSLWSLRYRAGLCRTRLTQQLVRDVIESPAVEESFAAIDDPSADSATLVFLQTEEADRCPDTALSGLSLALDALEIIRRSQPGMPLRVRILPERDTPVASVAKVAMSHSINANIVDGWRKLAREGAAESNVVQREFVPVAVAPKPEIRARDD